LLILYCVIATLFQRLPNLKLGISFDEIEWSAPHKDVGIVELPVTW
jgi:nitric oxide reductase